jgi:hypothetical protein
MAMTPEDCDLVAKTPNIMGISFTNLFGGSAVHERPKSKWGILCVNRTAQPYAPHSPGKSGLVLRYLDTALLEDTCETFLLFLNMNPALSRHEKQIRYLGTYTKVPIVHATVEQKEWLGLPKKVSGIFQHFLPFTLLVRLFLMAHCSLMMHGYVAFILQQELMCAKHMQEYPCANRVRVGPHPQQMPFTTGLNKIKGGTKVSENQTLGLHLNLVKRWVLGIDLPRHKNNLHHTRNLNLRS